MRKIQISYEEIKNVIDQSLTMIEASIKLGIHFNTFKRISTYYGLYKPNQGSKGCKRKPRSKIATADILNGLYPQYHTYKLKLRLLNENLIENKCSECNIPDIWNNKELKLELDHINGISHDHRLENLRLLCPNCHSQTATFRFKRGKTRA